MLFNKARLNLHVGKTSPGCVYIMYNIKRRRPQSVGLQSTVLKPALLTTQVTRQVYLLTLILLLM